jgi:hypothetical protein
VHTFIFGEIKQKLKRMKSGYLLLCVVLFIVYSSCQYEPGIKQVELTLDTVPFDRIHLESSADVRIIQSDNFQVVIKGMQKDVDDVDVNVIDNRLSIDEHGTHPDEMVIKIFVPEISQLECQGSSDIFGESNFQQNRNMDIHVQGSGKLDFAIQTDDVDLDLSGSAYVYLEGTIRDLDANITGSGWLRSFNLISEFSDVSVEGSGSAEVTANNDLDAFISGSGDIYFKGHPSITSQITGSGKVIDAN